ncbi:DUF732 domain-containing protein [Mycobacterium sp. 94-17]|uniref:DUF732 domain-containing protein n=1 Tax=Mycobacterium sp. 94-17 TaxID=2986147 RepID=UPI002D1F1ABA|nr:DUF732 domain-containing protein [Mycobacterium sp. 94-17]MEB4210015.1 DUF732 domain-containing protein [Mycobacterium sp. 94-17]
MRPLSALSIVVSAAIGVAPFSDADAGPPGGDEAAFLTSLRSAGITYSTPDGAIKFAEAVCASLGNGELGPRMVDELKSENPGLTNDHATSFLAIAVKYYCPQRPGRR